MKNCKKCKTPYIILDYEGLCIDCAINKIAATRHNNGTNSQDNTDKAQTDKRYRVEHPQTRQ